MKTDNHVAGLLNKYSRCLFTLIELMLVIAIIAILAAMLMPALKKTRDLAKNTECRNNLRQQGQATLNYTTDYNEFLPYCYYGVSSPVKTFFFAISPYILGKDLTRPAARWEYKAFNCPSARYKYMYENVIASYGANCTLFGYYSAGTTWPSAKLTKLMYPSITMGIGDGRLNITSSSWGEIPAFPDSTVSGGDEIVTSRHDKGVNITFLDFHVAYKKQPASNVNMDKIFYTGSP